VAAEVAKLTQQVQALERQVTILVQLHEKQGRAAAASTSTADTAAPALAARPAGPDGREGKEEALALYGSVDELVADGQLEEARQAVAAYDAKHAGTEAAGWTRSLHRELAVVGKAVPADWSIEKWYQGEANTRLDGEEPTLVLFWESWCPHCRKAVPDLEKIYQEHKGRGLRVLGVTRITRSATEESVTGFVKENDITYPMAKETGALAEYFSVKGIPAAAVVKNGTIIWRGHPMRITEALLERWL
jgi:thiol-disulfide isomerase/thioredoxin